VSAVPRQIGERERLVRVAYAEEGLIASCSHREFRHAKGRLIAGLFVFADGEWDEKAVVRAKVRPGHIRLRSLPT
jgi:hypothetical protein